MRRWRPSRRARLPDAPGLSERAGGRAPTRTDEERALELAYRYIGSRERTVSEVRARLVRADLAPSAIDAAIGELREFGYLDDARYARVFAQDKRALESWGRGRIERVLSERGIERELIASALAAARDGAEEAGDEHGRALELLRRRFPRPPDDLRGRERALGVLLRKGYDSDTAYEAVRAWAGDRSGDG